MTDLLPCPFCGVTPKDVHECDYCEPPEYHVICLCRHSKSKTPAEAIAAWNTRAIKSPLADELIEEMAPKFVCSNCVDAAKQLARAAIAAHDSGLAKQQHLDDCALSTAMLECGLATGHGDTIADMAREIPSQVMELRDRLSAAEAENARLRVALERARSDLFEMVNPSEDIRFRPAIDRIDSALKGGT